MNTITKTIFLTLVMIFLGSVGMSEAPTAKSAASGNAAKKSELELAVKNAEAATKNCGQQGCPKDVIEALQKAQKELSEFNLVSTAGNETCNKHEQAIKDIVTKFPPAAQQRALVCMQAQTEDTPEGTADLTGAVLRSLSGIREQNQEVCSVKGAKSDQADLIKDKATAIEKLERALEKIEDEIIKKEREKTEELAKLNESRVTLREEWESTQTEQDKKQVQEQNNLRDAQIKLQAAIREANAKLIAQRQEYAKIRQNRYASLNKAGVQSGQAMQRTCNIRFKKYLNEAGYTNNRVSKNLSSGSNTGGGKVKDLKSFMLECLKEQDEIRNSIYQSSADLEVQMANNLKDRQVDIQTLESEYKVLSKNYNEALQRNANSMTKAQQAYFQKDMNLEIKIKEAQIAFEKERQTLETRKQRLLQQIQAAELSDGEIKSQEVAAGVDSMRQYLLSIKGLHEDGCPQASRYKYDRSETLNKIEKIDEAEKGGQQ